MGKFIITVIILALIIGGFIYYNKDKASPTPGESKAEITIKDTPPNTPPNEPVLRPVVAVDTAVVTTDTMAFLTGEVNPKGSPTNYWYQYGTAPENLTNRTQTQLIGSGYESLPAAARISGLSKNTTYYFALVGENYYGRSTSTSATFKTASSTTLSPGGLPTANTLPASSIKSDFANLRGQIVPNKAATQYWFEYGQTPSLGRVTSVAEVSDINNGVTATVSISNLQPNTTYYFRINAQNKFGTVNGPLLNFKSLTATTSTSSL